MKIRRLLALVFVLLLSVNAVALAEKPAADSLKAEIQSIRGNRSFTLESYPDMWLTPFYVSSMLEGNEKNPPVFVKIPAREGSSVVEFDYEDCYYVDFDTLVGYYYYVEDDYPFETFLKKVEDDTNIIKDGSDGDALYLSPDRNRAYALITLEGDALPKFTRLYIQLTDNTRDMKAADLQAAIEEEIARIKDAYTVETLDGYWSEGVYATVQLQARNDDVSLSINTSGLTIVQLEDDTLETIRVEKNDKDRLSSEDTEIALDTYSYVFADGNTAYDLTLEDGTVFTAFNTDYTGYAALPVLAEAKYGSGDPLYLTIQIDCAPEDFPKMLEEIYGRITVTVGE